MELSVCYSSFCLQSGIASSLKLEKNTIFVLNVTQSWEEKLFTSAARGAAFSSNKMPLTVLWRIFGPIFF